jgi:hypothetical protein
MQATINQAHYALQTCDVKSYQGQKRFASDSRTEISKKCIKSFLNSIVECTLQKPEITHTVAIIDDHSSKELVSFIERIKEEYQSEKIIINFIQLSDKTGISESIKACYEWLQENGKGLVYQVQDDYLFTPNAITDIVEIYQQIYAETGTHSIISPWNDSWLWLSPYRNRSTPRTVIVGKKGYWIQYYDMSCSFLTSHEQFSKHWDLYTMFFYMINKLKENNSDLENKSLNYMLTQRGILGLVPVNSVAFHLQSDLEKDPHIDYRPLWDSINVT